MRKFGIIVLICMGLICTGCGDNVEPEENSILAGTQDAGITEKANSLKDKAENDIVTVVNDAVNSGKHSWLYVLNLTALLTINLGVFNLLPLPALDGGRIFFMLIELIRGKPIPVEKEAIVHLIGFILLMLLMVFILYNDIKNVFFFAMPFVP